MALVKEYQIGNTKIKVYDDAYKNNTPEDNQRIIDRVSEIYTRSLYSQMNRKKQDNTMLSK